MPSLGPATAVLMALLMSCIFVGYKSVETVGFWHPKRHGRQPPVQLGVRLGNCLRGIRGQPVDVLRRVPTGPGWSEL